MDSEGWEVFRLGQHPGPSKSTFTSVLSLLTHDPARVC